MSIEASDATAAAQIVTELLKLVAAVVVLGSAIIPIVERRLKGTKKKAKSPSDKTNLSEKLEIWMIRFAVLILGLAVTAILMKGYRLGAVYLSCAACLFGILFFVVERSFSRFYILMAVVYGIFGALFIMASVHDNLVETAAVNRASVNHQIQLILYREKWSERVRPNAAPNQLFQIPIPAAESPKKPD